MSFDASLIARVKDAAQADLPQLVEAAGYRPTQAVTVEQFVVALIGHVESLLIEDKGRMWTAFADSDVIRDETQLFSDRVRELTSFLAQVRDWTTYQAGEALEEFGRVRPAFTADLLADIQASQDFLQKLLVRLIFEMAPRERAA